MKRSAFASLAISALLFKVTNTSFFLVNTILKPYNFSISASFKLIFKAISDSFKPQELTAPGSLPPCPGSMHITLVFLIVFSSYYRNFYRNL